MIIKIESNIPITENIADKIRDIFQESLCPNESMRNTFSNFTLYKDGVVKFGDESNYEETIAVTSRLDKR